MIIMIKKLEPFDILLPNPVMAKVNMHGHRVEQNSPTLTNAIAAVIPPLNMPMTNAVMPQRL
jgi:hypothetical protein